MEKITPKGLGFGLDRQDLFSSKEGRSISYHKDDVFLFITAGITEAKSVEEKEFSENNLIKV